MKAERLFTRNFTFLILGQISSLLGNYTLKFALSMYILEQTGSASVFAAMLAVAMLPTILLSPFGGILADRANRRWIMVGLDSLSGLTVLTAGLLLPFGSDLLVIGALLVVLSVLAAFESPTVQACIPQILSEDNLMRGNAAVNQAQAITSLMTPFLGSNHLCGFWTDAHSVGRSGLLFSHVLFGMLHPSGISETGRQRRSNHHHQGGFFRKCPFSAQGTA